MRHHTVLGFVLGFFAIVGFPSSPVWASSSGQSAAITALPAYYGFTKTVTLTNQGNATALNVVAHVVLDAPETSYAHVTLTGESMAPVSTHRDRFGNLIGVFHWPTIKPHASVTIVLHYQATSSDVSYRLPATYPPYNKNSAIYKFYTNPSLESHHGINTDAPQIRQLDAKVTRGLVTPYQKAQALFQWVVQHIRYNYSLKASGSALNTLKNRIGICSDFADLYVSMLRTEGIPARLVGGYVTNNGGGQGGFHQWTEFYLPSVGWVVADPTWGKYGYFAALQDDWHIPLYDGSRSDISVHWQYAGNQQHQQPYLSIGYHYHFVTEQSPPPTTKVKLPMVAVTPPVKIQHALAPSHIQSLWIGVRNLIAEWVQNAVHAIETTLHQWLSNL